MAGLLPLENCFAPKSQQELEEDAETYKRYADLVVTLPRVDGWGGTLDWKKYKGFWFPEFIIPGIMAFHEHFKARESDIIVSTVPRSGTTWIKALTFSIFNRNKIHPSSPDHPLCNVNPHMCVPFLEMLYIGNNNQMPNTDVLPSPRLMSTHLSYSLLPPSIKQLGCKIVCFYRNPKSTLISQWRLFDDLRGDTGEPLQLDKYVDLFASGVSLFGPAWDHIAEYTEAATVSTNVLRLSYEDMSENPVPILKKLAELMSVPFTEEEEKGGMIDEILKLCSFKNLSNLEVNKNALYYSTGTINFPNDKFFRKGEVKEWAKHLTPEMIEKLDKLAKEKLGREPEIMLLRLDSERLMFGAQLTMSISHQ